MRLKNFYICITALFFTCIASLSFAEEKRVIKIGTEGAYPPFNYTDDQGNLVGFDIDIANALCQELNAQCKFVPYEWDKIIDGLIEKKFDAIIASMSITEERKKRVSFSEKYYQTPARILIPKSMANDYVINGLRGKRIGVQRSTTHSSYLMDQHPNDVRIVLYARQDNANKDFANGEIEALLADSLALHEVFFKDNSKQESIFFGPELNDPKWFGEGAGVAVRQGEEALAQEFTDAIKSIREKGIYQQINAKHFPFDIYGE